ncbi:hypothetical protein AR1Y2_3134 [Anaerostipes rhamnosivorans]|uniref:Uncharacterized protein n=1 Tax=Anaerostipes rhamnosivorans TaxID=1229621 RepID=A0A4P8IFI0_9FIRM|nr:hypothetical protein AR1Y2_3134 [Anaerostipes rhamnosivorans]
MFTLLVIYLDPYFLSPAPRTYVPSILAESFRECNHISNKKKRE